MKPERKSYSYRIYVDLCIAMRLRLGGYLKEKRRDTIRRVAKERNVPPYVVRNIYDRSIRRQLRAGVRIQDLK